MGLKKQRGETFLVVFLTEKKKDSENRQFCRTETEIE
jgi:hypothetical protein